MFPVKIWNHFDSAIEESPKTTNCGEGFHNALNSVFHCSHPSVWYLFDGLQRQRDMACHKLTLVNTEAGRSEVKKRKYANQHKILAESVRKYCTEDDVLRIEVFTKNGKLVLNLKFTCIQTIYMLSILN